MELAPFGELIPESFDAIRDGDKIVARVAHRAVGSGGGNNNGDSTVLSVDDWKAMRESRINEASNFNELVSRFAYQTADPERRRSRSVGDDDDLGSGAVLAAAAAASTGQQAQARRPVPQPQLRTNSANAAPAIRKPTRPVGAPAMRVRDATDDSDDFESAPSESTDQLTRESIRTISAKLEDIDEEMRRINAELAKANAPIAVAAPAAAAKPALLPRVAKPPLTSAQSAGPSRSRAPSGKDQMDELDALLNFSGTEAKSPMLARTKSQFTTSAPVALARANSSATINPGGAGPPPKPQKSEQAMIRAEQLKRGRSNARAVELPDPRALSPGRSFSPSRGTSPDAASPRLLRGNNSSGNHSGGQFLPPQRSLSPSRSNNSSNGRIGGGGPSSPQAGRQYASTGPTLQLPHMPSRQPLFDGLPAPILMPALAAAVTKTSGPFACPVCFKSYPIAADVFHHVQKRHDVDLLDGPSVCDANEAFHTNPSLQRTVSVNGSGQLFDPARARAVGSGGSVDSAGEQQLPPGWTRVWSKSKQKFYFFNERTGASIWTLAGVFAAK